MNLHLNLLGEPTVSLDGSTVELPPKSLALLAYLLIEGRSKRDLLAKILWPNVSANPRNNLSQERASLIKHLGFDALQGDPETLEILELVSCDVNAFRNDSSKNIRSAWSLYRGEFLQNLEFHPRLVGGRAFGEEFEFWLAQQRGMFDEQHRKMSMSLALEEVQRGAFEQAIPLLDLTQSSEHSVPEDAARILMLCFGALGQPDRATAVFAKIAARLMDDLGVEPMRLTREVCELARSEPEACVQRLRALLPTTSPPPRNRNREEQDVKFVGRSLELQSILQALLTAGPSRFDGKRNEKPASSLGVRCVLLWGEPGVGKTRLIEESVAALELAADMTGWLRADARATPDQLPLLMIQRAARNVLLQDPKVPNQLNQITREALARFLPDILEANETLIPPDLEQRALFSALRAVFSSSKSPTLLVLEDLHWADEGSIAFIEYLLADAPTSGLVVLATARDSERSRSNLDRLTSLFRDQHGGLLLTLDGISSEAVHELAESFDQLDVDATALHRRTGGNPLFILELLQGQDAGRKRLTELLQDRIRACGELASQVLEALVVVGDGRSVGVLRDVSGRRLEETILALEALETARLIRQVESEVFFRHDLIRELIGPVISSSRRGLLELRAARALRSQPILAAQHYLACQRLWDQETTEQAAKSFLDAGRQCAGRGGLEAALGWLDLAWSTNNGIPWRFDVTLVRARLLERYGRYREASETLNRTSPFLTAATKVQRASWWSLKSKLELSAHGDHAQARQHAEQALIECAESNDPDFLLERCRALRNLGWALRVNRDLLESAVQLRASLAIAEMINDRDEHAASLHALGFCLIELRDPTALTVLESALEIVRQTNNEKEIEALNFLGIYFERVEGDYSRAKQHFQHAFDQAKLWGASYAYTYLNNIAIIHFYLHEYSEARDAYLFALQEYQQQAAENEFELAYILSNLAEVEVRLGAKSEALDYLRKSRDLLERKHNGTLSADLDFIEADLQILEHDIAGAIAMYQACIEKSVRFKYPMREAHAHSRLALLEKSASSAERAIACWDGPVTQATQRDVHGDHNTAAGLLEHDPFELGVLKLVQYFNQGLEEHLHAAKRLLGKALRLN
jgi:DNA-binding SARP family transcriptional activator